MWAEIDPRPKLFIAAILSSMAIFTRHADAAALLIAYCIAAYFLFGVDFGKPVSLVARILPALLTVSVLQIALNRAGAPLISIGGIGLVTSGGVRAASFMAVRVIVIAGCGFIVGSIGFSDFLLAMKAMRVPYELSFMSAMGAKFLPLLSEEMRDSLISAQLRGADLKKMGLFGRFRLYSEVLMPATITAMMRAEQISWALELKGFNPGKSRTYWRKLSMGTEDWLVFPAGFIAAALFIITNYAI